MTMNDDHTSRMRDDETLESELALATGAYALDALEGEELARFEEALAASEELRCETTGLQDTALELARALPAEDPGPALRANVLAAIASEPQLPAHEVHDDAPVDDASDTDAASTDAPEALAPVRDISSARGWRRAAAPLITAAAALALIITSPFLGGLPTSQALAVAAADDAQVAEATMEGGSATLVWSGELGRSVLTVNGLLPLGDELTYELWYVGEDGPRSAGIVTADADGTTTFVLEGEMHAGDAVGVTIEPAGGSEQPTTEPLMVIATA